MFCRLPRWRILTTSWMWATTSTGVVLRLTVAARPWVRSPARHEAGLGRIVCLRYPLVMGKSPFFNGKTLVNLQKAIENDHLKWIFPLKAWWFSIVFCMFTRGYVTVDDADFMSHGKISVQWNLDGEDEHVQCWDLLHKYIGPNSIHLDELIQSIQFSWVKIYKLKNLTAV